MPHRIATALAVLLGLVLVSDAAALTQRATVPRTGGINDGDTVIVRLGGRREVVRFLGVQAFELSTYNNRRPSAWRGECHSVAAARYVLRMVRRARHRVRLSSPVPTTDERGRLIRRVELRLGGRWRDLAAMELSRGLVMWLHHVKDTAINERYNRLEQTAAARRRGLWDPAACGPGPAPGAAVEVRILSDPIGEDRPEGEWVRLTNTGEADLPLTGWYLGNAGPKRERYPFPAGTVLGAGRSLIVVVGAGADGGDVLYRGLGHPLFENSVNGYGAGDGAYLVDPRGNVRFHQIYPCRVACADPAQGALEVRANAVRGPEYADVRNVSGAPVDLRRYQLRFNGAFPFPDDSLLGPGETMRVYVKGDPAQDTRLVKHIGYDGAYLPDAGGTARVATFDEITLACDAWGAGRC